MTTISIYFGELPDPRVERCKHHKLLDIVTIAVCAVISNADGWADSEAYGQTRKYFMRIRYGEIRNQAGCPTRLAREGGRKVACLPHHTAARNVFGIAQV
jgi:hypothetical protein